MYDFIVNPDAGGGRGIKIWKKVKRQLNRLGIAYKVFVTEKPGDAIQYASDLTERSREPRTVIIIGGDGTMNEVLEGLMFNGSVTLGYIPAGYGNDLAKSLKLPRDSSKCLKRILNPQYYKFLDYGVASYGERMEHRRFLISAGIGMDGAVCHNLHCSKMKKVLDQVYLGKLCYIFVGIQQLIMAHPVKGYLLLDGIQRVELNHIYFISAHIHPFEGGGFKFAPVSDPCDGKLTLCVVHHSRKIRLILFFIRSFLGCQKKYKGVRSYNCQEVEIHVEEPMSVHADGEDCMCQTQLHLRCIPGKVRMIV